MTDGKFMRRRALVRGASGTLILAAIAAMTIGTMAQGSRRQFSQECALKDIVVMTAIEDHGIADDRPSDQLGKAGLAALDARIACLDGRVGEALALYDSVLINLETATSARLR